MAKSQTNASINQVDFLGVGQQIVGRQIGRIFPGNVEHDLRRVRKNDPTRVSSQCVSEASGSARKVQRGRNRLDSREEFLQCGLLPQIYLDTFSCLEAISVAFGLRPGHESRIELT